MSSTRTIAETLQMICSILSARPCQDRHLAAPAKQLPHQSPMALVCCQVAACACSAKCTQPAPQPPPSPPSPPAHSAMAGAVARGRGRPAPTPPPGSQSSRRGCPGLPRPAPVSKRISPMPECSRPVPDGTGP